MAFTSALLCATPALLAAGPQTPAAPWRTLPTAHYRIHHPDQPAFRDFARHVATRIEGIHRLLEQEIGHALPGPTNVVVMNPMATANGMVLPDLNRPSVTLWTEPIDSDTEISHSGAWIDLLVLHELVHLHHLTWPDRRPGLLSRLPGPLKLSRVAQRAPGWITEGYATMLEGRLTGEGRPHGAIRATVLRQLAREGRLPGYKDLSGVNANVQSGIRYQAGSAFMEWLETQHPKGHRLWPELWARMASRVHAGFPEAFLATFGERPELLHARWNAELTRDALEVERRVQAQGLREGEPFSQVPDGGLRNLSVSPDGRFLLAQASTDDARRRGLQVYALAPDPKAEAREQEARARRQKKDPGLPEDAPRQLKTRSPRHTLAAQAFAAPQRPRWEADGRIAFEAARLQADGTARVEVDHWQPEPSKAPAPTIHHVHPVKAGRTWTVALAGRTVTLPFEPYGPVAHDPQRGVVYASTPVAGIFNLVRLAFDPATGQLGPLEPLTRTPSAALYPAPTPDGKALYYCQMSARGTQIRRLDLGLPPLPAVGFQADPTPFVQGAILSRPDAPTQVPEAGPVPQDHPYRPGESHRTFLRTGFVFDPSQAAYLLGAGGSDFLGRVQWQALGALGISGTRGRGPRGAMASFLWRGSAWNPSVHAFGLQVRPSVQRFLPLEGLDRDRTGLELAVAREWSAPDFPGRLGLSLARERQSLARGADLDRTVAGLDLRQGVGWNQHRLTWTGSARLIAQTGRTEGQRWSLGRLQLQGSLLRDDVGLSLQGEEGRLSGDPGPLDAFLLGGQSAALVPTGLEAQQVQQAALPLGLATGDRFRRWKADLGGLYFERLQVWTAGAPRPQAQRVAGIEVRTDMADLTPWMRDMIQRHLGPLSFRVAVHRTFDGVMKGRTGVSTVLTYRF